MTTRTPKLAIFTVDLPEANAITQQVLEAYHPHVTGLIRSKSIRRGQRTWDSIKQLYRKSGSFLMAKGLETAMCPIASLVPRLSGLVPRTLPLRRIARNYRVKMNSTSDINSYHMRQLVKSWKPDLLISIYINQRLAKDLLNVAPMGAINVHPSLLPQHRGLFPYIWAMAGGDRETGVTVHWMDETLDTGAIIQQRSTPIHQGESAISLAHRCADLGGKMLVDAIDRVRRGVASHIRQEPGQGSYHSWPDRDCLRRCKQHGHPYLSLVDMWRELSRAA